MNDIVIKDSVAFEEVILNFEKGLANIDDIFKDQDKLIKRINKTGIWTGKTQDSFCKKYFELQGNYDNIESSLLTLIEFMKNALDNYKKAEKQINTNIEENLENLDVN